ncbi:MAG: OmpA family protein [Alphaproteobacteria bacterium]|nr:OmpA family protein [Alphaproteobacteria bacterium]
MPRPLVRSAALALLCALLAPGCKKKAPEVAEEDADATRVQQVDQALSVVALTPSTGRAGQPFAATLRGAGLVATPRVFLGAEPARDVSWKSARELLLTVPALPVGTYDVEVVNPAGETAILRQGLTIAEGGTDCSAVTVYFPLDGASVDATAAAVLERQVGCLRDANARVRVEGHCDERGTIDYNLALGDRRAEAVAAWLAARGVPRARLETISYGEERPAVSGQSEASWAKNRRAEIRLAR